MQSPRYVAKYGAIRFLSCPGRAGIVSKFRAVSGTACKMPSPTPPKSAKVELSAGKNIRQHDPIVVAVRFIAEHRDIELIRAAAGQHFLDSAGAGHAIADYNEFHFRHLSAP